MKNVTLLLLSGLCSTHLFAQLTCATAATAVAGPIYTVAAVTGVAPNSVCQPSVNLATQAMWYRYSPAQDTTVVISTDLPQNAGKDTRIQVYTGTCGSLVCAGGDDDSGEGYLAVATVNAQQGTVYYIVFDNYWGPVSFDFQLSETAPLHHPVDFTMVGLSISGWADCVVDMNGDHLDDVVSTTSSNINVNYQLPGGGFNNVNIPTAAVAHWASWSIAAGDLDANGYNDLMYGDYNGVSLMFANDDGTAYSEVSFPEYVFCQRTNMVDINNDGHLDAFSCHDVAANVYYLNDGNNNFSFHQGGFGEDCGNYGSIWIDIDNDHLMDLFVAKCGCDPIDILYHNNGDGTFTNVSSALGFADSQQSWSSAWGDFDNDGDMDVLVGTSSGDYHKLMRNDGGTAFTNVTPGSGFDAFSGSSIEWTTHDFNNDGYLDVLGGGKLMLNDGDMTFTQMTVLPGNGPVGDLNNDGFLDIMNGNAAYMNDGNSNHYLTVNTIGTASNKNGIGARVEVTSALGTQIRDVKSGDGFAYMSSLNSHFGLGSDTTIDHVTVYWPSGVVNVVQSPAIDTVLDIVEDVNTNVADRPRTDGIQLYPNPADDALNIIAPMGTVIRAAQVLDVMGKSALTVPVNNGKVDISALSAGIYVLQVRTPGGVMQQKFTKR